MKSLFLEILKTELLEKEVRILAAHESIKTRQEAVMNLKIEELIKINQIPPIISRIGKLHAPKDGYVVDDREYLAGQFIPSPIDEDDLRTFPEFQRKTRKIKVPVSLREEFQELLESFAISDKPEFGYGQSWLEANDEVSYCYVEWNSGFLEALVEANTKIQNAYREEANKTKGQAPEGKVHVTGVLTFTKVEIDPYYGPSEKMLVTLENGSTVWGTLPKALYDVETGSKVEFTATFSVSNDSHHAFFKRPSKVKAYKEIL